MYDLCKITTPAEPVVTPAIDIHETPTGLVLTADMPGITIASLHVAVENNVLEIRGQPAAGISADVKPLYAEYRVGQYHRSFILGDDVETDEIKASLDDGVLTLELPRARRLRPRKIEVSGT